MIHGYDLAAIYKRNVPVTVVSLRHPISTTVTDKTCIPLAAVEGYRANIPYVTNHQKEADYTKTSKQGTETWLKDIILQWQTQS
jgi:hypothetical protein